MSEKEVKYHLFSAEFYIEDSTPMTRIRYGKRIDGVYVGEKTVNVKTDEIGENKSIEINNFLIGLIKEIEATL